MEQTKKEVKKDISHNEIKVLKKVLVQVNKNIKIENG